MVKFNRNHFIPIIHSLFKNGNVQYIINIITLLEQNNITIKSNDLVDFSYETYDIVQLNNLKDQIYELDKQGYSIPVAFYNFLIAAYSILRNNEEAYQILSYF